MTDELMTVTNQSIKVVEFILGNESYAVPIGYVKEIIRKPEVLPLPNAPQHITGVINLRNEIISILSLADRFGLNGTSKVETKIMVVEYQEVMVGLEVDNVHEVRDINTDQLSDAPINTSVDQEMIQGIGRLGEQLIIILNLDVLLGAQMSAYKELPRSIDAESEDI